MGVRKQSGETGVRGNGRPNTSSTKTPQLDSPGKIDNYWIKATCDSRFCVLDVSEHKTYSLDFTNGVPIHGPLTGTKLVLGN